MNSPWILLRLITGTIVLFFLFVLVTDGARGADQRGLLHLSDRVGGIDAYEQGTPKAIVAVGGSSQSTPVNSVFATPLQAQVTDGSGYALEGIDVVFAGPGTGAGIASGGTVTTNSSGIASFTARANGTAGGPYIVTATTGTLSAHFSLTNTSAKLYLPLTIR